MDLDSYYHNRILRWAGHVARMPMTRAPRQLLTGCVAHSRPNGCPEMTWGRTLKKALKCKGLPVNFKEWRAIAEDRSECRSGDNGQGSGKKASKIQKKAPKKSFQESADVFTVFLPYFKHVFTSKEGIWELLQQIICPLGYILFVGELF